MINKTVGIVGTGPSALMAATILAQNGVKIRLFDQKKAPARKFLVAGHGGFNLTNNENLKSFVEQYDHILIKDAIRKFDPSNFRDFLESIGIDTYIGSSGKIFPKKGMKPIEVLKTWLDYLEELGVEFSMNHRLTDFSNKSLSFIKGKDFLNYQFDSIVFALGGASWSKTGSDGRWLNLFEKKGIKCIQFGASNSGFILSKEIDLSEFKGEYIKNCSIFSGLKEKKGDIVISGYGIEGAPVYALNGYYREGHKIYIDFKPDLTLETIFVKIRNSKNPTEGLKNLKLAKGAIAWIKQALTKSEFQDLEILSKKIKKMPIIIEGFRPVDEVISTVGGVAMENLDESFRLKAFPTVYSIGEMLDWDAPTGGYLIQACVSSGYVAAQSIISQS